MHRARKPYITEAMYLVMERAADVKHEYNVSPAVRRNRVVVAALHERDRGVVLDAGAFNRGRTT